MTLTAWWALDAMEITEPAGAQEALEEAWGRYYPHGGRGVIVRFGHADTGMEVAPLRVDVDLNEGRAVLHWLPDTVFAAEPGIPAHPRPLIVGDDPYEPPITGAGGAGSRHTWRGVARRGRVRRDRPPPQRFHLGGRAARRVTFDLMPPGDPTTVSRRTGTD